VRWIDAREDAFPSAPLPAHIETVTDPLIEAEVDEAPAGAFHLVLTHEHALDLRLTEAILRRGDFGFLGMIGSRSKRSRFMGLLLERGIATALLARVTCPIGVEGIAGKEPAVIAAAVVAQLLQLASAPDTAGGPPQADDTAPH